MKFSKIFTSLLIFLFSISFAQSPVKEIGELQLKGTQLSDSKGNAVRLVGTSFGWSCFHPRFYNEGAVKWLKDDWHVNIVRASMGVDPDGGYLKKSEENLKLIETVINAAIKEGVYVIVDWHTEDIHTKEAKLFFDKISKKYGKYPNVIYEVFNEPNKESWPEVKSYAEDIIKTIRKNDPNNIILVGSPEWDQRIDLVQKDPITDASNIMYTVHFYAGTHKQWLRDRTDEAMKNGIPVFISESGGMEASGDGKMDYVEWQKYFDWMNDHKLSWITWSISDKKETCSMLLPSASSKGNWKTSDLNESGIKTRDYLRQFNERGEYMPTFVWKERIDKTSSTTGKLTGSASSIEYNFKGNSTEIKLKNNKATGIYNYISVELDGKYLGRYKVDNNDFKTFTFDVLDKNIKIHNIKIFKATEASNGEVVVDVSETSAIPTVLVHKKRIEFIGDSITCGFGNDDSQTPCHKGEWFDEHNAYFSYAPDVARMLNADFLLSAVSGIGIYRNYNTEQSENPILPDVYDYLYLRTSEPAKFNDEFQPDLVSICLGTNDFSNGDGKKARLPFNRYKFVGNYIELIQKLYRKYPNTQIIMLNSPMISGDNNKIFLECLDQIKDFFKNDTIHQALQIFKFAPMQPKGCDGHPHIEDDKTMANELFPTFKKILDK